jgi:hypothetical protein
VAGQPPRQGLKTAKNGKNFNINNFSTKNMTIFSVFAVMRKNIMKTANPYSSPHQNPRILLDFDDNFFDR